MQVFYTAIQATDFSSEAIQAIAILKRWVMLLLLVLMLLLLNTIEVSERCECGLEKGHSGKHQTSVRASVRELVEWQRLKQQHGHDLLK